jgi:multisubunit Na+/H+ antiporter MnhB subunit
MKFRLKLKTALTAVWGAMFLDFLRMAYSRYVSIEWALSPNGTLEAGLLVAFAILFLAAYVGVDRFFFKESRTRRLAEKSPKRIRVAFVITTILGTAFGQASVIWGGEALKATGRYSFLFVLYGIGVLFMAYAFPWRWRTRDLQQSSRLTP